MNYQPQDTVVHVRGGVCKIESISELTLREDEPETYIILTQLYERASKLYVPVDKADQFLRPLLTKEEILSIIHRFPQSAGEWIPDEKMRTRTLQQNLKTGDIENYVSTLSMLFQKRQEFQEIGKRFRASDERLLKEAEKTVTREFAYVLGIAPEDVFSFIQRELGED